MQRNNGKSRWQQPPGIDRTEVEYRPWPWPDWRPKPNPCVFFTGGVSHALQSSIS